MQQKRTSSLKATLLGLSLIVLAATAVYFAVAPVAPHRQPIEKELDATALLEAAKQ